MTTNRQQLDTEIWKEACREREDDRWVDTTILYRVSF